MTKILVLENDSETTDLLTSVLGDERVQIQSVDTPAGAVALLPAFDPDVVVIDMLSPEIETLRACRMVRENSDVPVLVLSVVQKPELVARALDEGADDFLNKPVQGKLLIASLKKLVRRAHAEKIAKDGNGNKP